MIMSEIVFLSLLGSLVVLPTLKKIYLKIKERSLLKTIFKRNFKNYSSIDECVICFENYVKNRKCIELYCNHKFHKNCLKKWLNERLTCPLCNTSLIKNNGKL